jgi:hypothetical protein
MLKARTRALILREMATRDGKDPDAATATFHTADEEGKMQQREISVKELEAAAAPLGKHETHCEGCAANLLGEPFGCFGSLQYPIQVAQEEWLMARLQSADEIGGRLFLDFTGEFKITGEPVREMRRAGFFEATKPVTRIIGKKTLGKLKADSNQLFQSILFAGNPLNPSHCMGFLLWLGGIRIDGKELRTASDDAGQVLFSLETSEERLARSEPDVGPKEEDPALAQVQSMLQAFYLSWAHEWPVLISA